MDELHFDGDPATDSTRRRLERVIKDQPRARWSWLAALAAGGAAFAFWQIRRRRKHQNGSGTLDEPDKGAADAAQDVTGTTNRKRAR